MDISLFKQSEQQQVVSLFARVFSDSEGETEGNVIGNLVNNLISKTPADEILGFVAHEQPYLLGCIFFTKFVVPDGQNAFILSPVAVGTEVQGIGVGQRLINHGLEHLAKLGVDLVFTYGDINFYSKVGFQQISEELIQAPFNLSYPEGWLAQSFNNQPLTTLKGSTRCVEALQDQQYW